MNVKSILVDLFKTEAIEEMAIAELNPHKVIQSSRKKATEIPPGWVIALMA